MGGPGSGRRKGATNKSVKAKAESFSLSPSKTKANPMPNYLIINGD